MALVKFTAPVDEIAGAIGGVVFQRSAAGKIARIRTKPTVSRTPTFAGQTALMSTYAYRWNNGLTQAQRDGWDAVAATTLWVNTLGVNYSPTGLNCYIRTQLVAAAAGLTGPSQWPDPVDEVDPGVTHAYAAATAIDMTAYGTLGVPPNGRIYWYWSGLQSPGSHTFSGPWIFVRSKSIATLPAPPYRVVSTIPAVHPTSRAFLRFRVYRSQDVGAPPSTHGRCSHNLYADIDIPAAP